MLFNSFEFALFLPLCFVIYWFVLQRNLKAQNLFILASSYFFYGWWDYRFLSLIAFSTLVDFLIGIQLSKVKDRVRRRLLLTASLLINLGFLGFFKYYNFFIDSLVDSFTFFGASINPDRLSIILPVGISFYTFQTLSYSIDVYRKKLTASKDFISFAAFVSFFPQLVAGPIERATHLLPQFYKKRIFSYNSGILGLKLILWGMFKKVVVADTCAYFVDIVYSDVGSYSWQSLSIAAILFSFQIYGDFSGYSDIARGVAKLFGFELMINFRYPYFSRNIAEFWRRWHISLSTWFRDYLYIPLGGSRGGIKIKIRNTIIIFVVSGFWHGANWTFMVWGFLHALAFLPLLMSKNNRNYIDDFGAETRSFENLFKVLLCFILVTILWVFFRADNIHIANQILYRISTFSSGKAINISLIVIVPLVIQLTIEWFGKTLECPMDIFKSRLASYTISFVLAVFVLIYFDSNNNSFIYFQF